MKRLLITLLAVELFGMLNFIGINAWADSNLEKYESNFGLNESFPTLADWLIYDIDCNSWSDEFLWAYNLPYDFPGKDDLMLFTQEDFSGNGWLQSALKNEPSDLYVGHIRNYYFWMHGKYLIVSSDDIALRYDKNESKEILYGGHTYGLDPSFMDNSILFLDDNNEWRILYCDNCTLNSLWLKARFNNDIDRIIKRELFGFIYNDFDSVPEGYLIAPMYKDPQSTLFDELWTINPSYLNNLTYSRYYDNHTYGVISNERLYQKRFDPIRSYLLDEDKNQCHVLSPRFSLEGKSLSLRFDIEICKLDSNNILSREPLHSIVFKYIYDHATDKWVKHE